MTTIDAVLPAAAAQPAATPGPVRFLGAERDYWRLMARGAVLLMVTLGIYRFWLTTDMRRFLWANTDVAGTSLEYTGTARELLLGFLIAMAILVPLNAVLFIVALNLDVVGPLSTPLFFIAFTVLGHFAVFRARRYRLTRTVLRGVRFHQTGSAWHYAACALLWWTLIVLSLGLLYPLAQAQLERFKMRNTYFGDLPGRFEGAASRLFLRGFLMWLIVVGPFVAAIVYAARTANWSALPGILTAGGADKDMINRLAAARFIFAIGFAIAAIVWAMLAAATLYPAFQAMLWRWWAGGLRFGEVTVTSTLRTGRVYRIYGRFLGYSILFSLAVGTIAGIAATIVTMLFRGSQISELGEIAAAVALIGFYVVVALGYSTIYQVVVRAGLWKAIAESLDVSNISALDRVSARGAPGSPVGEGLADALNVGGI